MLAAATPPPPPFDIFATLYADAFRLFDFAARQMPPFMRHIKSSYAAPYAAATPPAAPFRYR